jgi:hypothetical protein
VAPGSHHPAGEEEGARLPLQLPHHGPVFGHLVIKMFGRPPFGAQVILNGHEYVAVVARGEWIGFVKEGNCFTEIADPQRLARVADAWPRDAAIGRLGQVCDRWIYSACLCFGLDLEEQERSGFRYGYAVYQAEYNRNLLLKSGAQMELLFDRILDRTRSGLDIPAIRIIFSLKNRPHRSKDGPSAQEIATGKPRYGLSWFRSSFGRLQLKAYTKGEQELRCRRSLDNFAGITTLLAGMADRFTTILDCADTGFLPDGLLDELPLPAQAGPPRIAGVDLNQPRIRAALSAALTIAPAPGGFTVAEHASRVRQLTGQDGYTTRQAAHDLRKLRGEQFLSKPGRTRRYHVPPNSARVIAAALTLRDHVIAPILAGVRSPRMDRKPSIWTAVDRDYENLRVSMQTRFRHVGIDTITATG